MITAEDLRNRHQQLLEYAKQKDSGYGSTPKPLFLAYGNFNESNWNGGDSVIRQWTSDYNVQWEQRNDEMVHDVPFNKPNEDDADILLIANKSYYEDTTYVQVMVKKITYAENDYVEECNQYMIEIYKSRGKTEKILKNGKVINLSEYVELINFIEATGFKFDMSIY